MSRVKLISMEINFETREDVSLKIKEKLPNDEIKKLERFLRYENYDDFIELINMWDLNYKSINQVKNVLTQATPSVAFSWSHELILDARLSSLIVGGLFLIKAEIWDRDIDYAKETIKKFSLFNEWRIRGVGIKLFSSCMIRNFGNFASLFDEYVNHENAKLRRVAISTAQEIALYKGNVDFMDLSFMNMLTPYLNETDPYVNSVSNETFGNFIKNHSELFYSWISNKMHVVQDAHGKASILYILSNNHATKYVRQSCDIIDYYIKEKDEKVKRARSAALRNLAKYHSKNISAWLENRMAIPNAVDHWSELQIDGLLDDIL